MSSCFICCHIKQLFRLLFTDRTQSGFTPGALSMWPIQAVFTSSSNSLAQIWVFCSHVYNTDDSNRGCYLHSTVGFYWQCISMLFQIQKKRTSRARSGKLEVPNKRIWQRCKYLHQLLLSNIYIKTYYVLFTKYWRFFKVRSPSLSSNKSLTISDDSCISASSW